MTTIEQWVWFYYDQGFSFVPAKSTTPPSLDNKKAAIKWEKYLTQRPTKLEVTKWLSDGLFGNIALILGHVSNDIVAIDLDDSSLVGDIGFNIDKAISNGNWIQKTGRDGGYHIIVKNNGDPGDISKDNLIKMEYRANGGYIIITPSIHPCGKQYSFVGVDKPEDLPPLKTIDAKKLYKDMRNNVYTKRDINMIETPVKKTNGNKPDCILKVWEGGLKAGDSWNDTAFALSNWYKQQGNTLEEVTAIMHEWNKKNIPPNTPNELDNTIKSAFKSEKKTGCTAWRELNYCPFENINDCPFIKPKRTKKTNGDAENPAVFSSLVYKDDIIYEQVFDPVTEKTQYVYLDKETHKFHYCDRVEKNGIEYIPINCQPFIKAGAIRLPSKPVDYGELSNLLSDIQSFIHKYVDVKESYEKFSTWYILFSWVLDDIHTTPYLRVLGDYGTGKSRYLKTIGRLLYKPMFLVTPTAAVVFRTIDIWNGSLVLDEFTPHEKVNETDPLMQVLCCGFERGIPVGRCEKDTNNIQFFDVFGAKLISSRRKFRDDALESRCLTEIVTETDRDDIPSYLPPSFLKEQAELRNKLLYFRLHHINDLDLEKIQHLEFPKGITKRLKQAFSGFAALFSFDKKAMDSFMVFVKEYSEERKEEASDTYEGKIINAMFNLFTNGYQHITSQDIAREMFDNFGISKEGNPVSAQGIGLHLKVLKIATKKKRIGDAIKRVVVEDKKLFASLKRKYVVDDSEIEEETTKNKDVLSFL